MSNQLKEIIEKEIKALNHLIQKKAGETIFDIFVKNNEIILGSILFMRIIIKLYQQKELFKKLS